MGACSTQMEYRRRKSEYATVEIRQKAVDRMVTTEGKRRAVPGSRIADHGHICGVVHHHDRACLRTRLPAIPAHIGATAVTASRYEAPLGRGQPFRGTPSKLHCGRRAEVSV
jgi:hypothetical protein